MKVVPTTIFTYQEMCSGRQWSDGEVTGEERKRGATNESSVSPTDHSLCNCNRPMDYSGTILLPTQNCPFETTIWHQVSSHQYILLSFSSLYLRETTLQSIYLVSGCLLLMQQSANFSDCRPEWPNSGQRQAGPSTHLLLFLFATAQEKFLPLLLLPARVQEKLSLLHAAKTPLP